MISCPSCGKANRDRARFCNACGWRLDFVVTCPTCGFVNAGDATFCNDCGSKLSAPEPGESPAESGRGSSYAAPSVGHPLSPAEAPSVAPSTNGTAVAEPAAAPSEEIPSPYVAPTLEETVETEDRVGTPSDLLSTAEISEPADDETADWSEAVEAGLPAMDEEAPDSPFEMDWSAIAALEAAEPLPEPVAEPFTAPPEPLVAPTPASEPAVEEGTIPWLDSLSATASPSSPVAATEPARPSASSGADEGRGPDGGEVASEPVGIVLARSLAGGRPRTESATPQPPLGAEGAGFAAVANASATPSPKARRRIGEPSWLMLVVLIAVLAILVALAVHSGALGLSWLDGAAPALATDYASAIGKAALTAA